MNIWRLLVRLTAMLAVCGVAPPNAHLFSTGVAGMALAQASSPLSHEGTTELEESLFVVDPHLKSARGAIYMLWIPQPIQKYCLGKTAQECSTIDYCIRTTNKNVPMCKVPSVDLRQLPVYPAGMRPRRVLGVTVFRMSADKGFGALQKYFDDAPPGSLDRLSAKARIQARIKFTRLPADDEFTVLEVLAVPPS